MTSNIGTRDIKKGGALGFQVNKELEDYDKMKSKILEEMKSKVGADLEKIGAELKPLNDEKDKLNKETEGKKDEEITQAVKDKKEDLNKKIDAISDSRSKLLKEYGSANPLVKQVVDLALLSNNMLKGEDLNRFVKRSIDLIS